ncbi:MAG: ATP-binding cassette domain-containing protein [Candidatus Methanoplasma sp.]|jgi:multidrug/hemolysin transport system ATP-binding protein|nr:ATP-binding cassette domain-containing protein [Candidatus Methanoplasma sp.]
MNAIEVSGLKKYFGDVKAVDDISFTVGTGQLFAFLGPNGAGKSTTIDMLCTFLRPDSGEARIFGNVLGKDDNKIRADIGVVFQKGTMDPLLTVKENLMFRGKLYGSSSIEDRLQRAMDVVDISDIADKRYGKLSGGQKRRTDVARALISTPKLLFLDEPTTGLDPQTRHKVWEMILDLKNREGMTVFLTTHYMEEAAGADYVMVIDKGRITAEGTPTELKERFSSDVMKLVPKDLSSLSELLRSDGVDFSVDAGVITIPINHTIESLPLIDRYREHRANIQILNGTVDDAFVKIVEKGGLE